MSEQARKRDLPVAGARYLRAPVPLHFPSEETVPESKRHLILRTALFQTLWLALEGRYAIGSDQFVYWNASDPGLRLAPDVFVSTSQRDCVFDSWKTWERGAPDLAVEIISDSDSSAAEWERKLARYLQAGIQELVRFDPDEAPGRRLRVWDRIEGDLVERAVDRDRAACQTLGLHWIALDHGELGAELRVARDEAGSVLLPTPDEERARQQGRAAEQEKRAAEQEKRAAEEARLRAGAEQRVAELEARLRELGEGGQEPKRKG